MTLWRQPFEGQPAIPGQIRTSAAIRPKIVMLCSTKAPRKSGRSERLFATLQDRLPKELRLAGIETVEAANA